MERCRSQEARRRRDRGGRTRPGADQGADRTARAARPVHAGARLFPSPAPARGPGRTHGSSARSSRRMAPHRHTAEPAPARAPARPIPDAHGPAVLVLSRPGPLPAGPGRGCDDLRPAAGAVGSSGAGHGLRPASCAPGLTDGATELLPEASSPVFAPVLSAQSPEQHPDPGPSAGRCHGPRRPPRPLPAPPGGRHLNTAADGCPLRSPRWSTGNTRGSLASMSPRQQPPWPQHRPAASTRAFPGRVRPRCGGAPTASSQSDPWWRRAWRRGTSPPFQPHSDPPFHFLSLL